MVAVPLWLSVKFTPVGRLPDSPITMEAPVGNPVVVTVKLCPVFAGWNVTLFALVMAGGWLTVIETVAALEVSAAAQAGPGAPQLSGLPRSVTVNWKLSDPK